MRRPAVRLRRHVRLTALALALLLVGSATRADAPAASEAAVGRLNHAGYATRRHCTAFAVAPRVALTASHCLAGVAPDRMTLLFGYARMTWAAEVRATRAVDLGGDVSALCLDADAPATLPTAVATPGAATAVGYGLPRPHVQNRLACRLVMVAGRDAVLGCPASHGASGGPVLDAAGRAVAVLSRTAPALSVAATIPPAAAAACD